MDKPSTLTVFHEFIRASRPGCVITVKQFDLFVRQLPIHIDTRDVATGNTALHVAAVRQLPDLVTVLIRHNATIDIQNDVGYTPLGFAVESGSCKAAKVLLDANANPNKPGGYGYPPLFGAVKHRNKDMMTLLLDYNARNDFYNNTPITPLSRLCKEGELNLVRVMLDYPLINVNTPDENGDIPLIKLLGVTFGNILNTIPTGIDQKERLKIVMEKAIYAGNKELIEILWKFNNQYDEAAKFLYGPACLIYACEVSRKQAVTFFLNEHVDVNGKVITDTALCTALKMIDLDISNLLIDSGADVNVAGTSSETPLHHAVTLGNFDLIVKLLRRGANPNALNSNGKSPIFNARSFVIFEKLVERGAVVSIALLQFFKRTQYEVTDIMKIVRLLEDIIYFNELEKSYETGVAVHVDPENIDLESVYWIPRVGQFKEELCCEIGEFFEGQTIRYWLKNFRKCENKDGLREYIYSAEIAEKLPNFSIVLKSRYWAAVTKFDTEGDEIETMDDEPEDDEPRAGPSKRSKNCFEFLRKK